MVVLGDDGQVEACFGTVCTECTIGLEIILDAPIELLGDVGQVESRFSPFRDSVSVGAR
jgi:hypothetical protein